MTQKGGITAFMQEWKGDKRRPVHLNHSPTRLLPCNNPLFSYHNGCQQFEGKDYIAGQGHSRPQNPTRQVEAVSEKGALLFIGFMLDSSTLDSNGAL